MITIQIATELFLRGNYDKLLLKFFRAHMYYPIKTSNKKWNYPQNLHTSLPYHHFSHRIWKFAYTIGKMIFFHLWNEKEWYKVSMQFYKMINPGFTIIAEEDYLYLKTSLWVPPRSHTCSSSKEASLLWILYMICLLFLSFTFM